MKTFKSVDALKTAALQKGASASVGGIKFNSTADKVNAVQFPIPVPEPVQEQPKPEPIPEPPKPVEVPQAQDLAPIVQSAVDAMAASVSEVTKDSARVMSEVLKFTEQLALANSSPTQTGAPADTPAKHWRLKVNRNQRTGLMESCDIERIG